RTATTASSAPSTGPRPPRTTAPDARGPSPLSRERGTRNTHPSQLPKREVHDPAALPGSARLPGPAPAEPAAVPDLPAGARTPGVPAGLGPAALPGLPARSGRTPDPASGTGHDRRLLQPAVGRRRAVAEVRADRHPLRRHGHPRRRPR